MEVLAGLILNGLLLTPVILLFVSLNRVSALNRRVTTLEKALAKMAAEVAATRSAARRAEAAPAASPERAASQPTQPVVQPEPSPRPRPATIGDFPLPAKEATVQELP
jgi:hypothetical protein